MPSDRDTYLRTYASPLLLCDSRDISRRGERTAEKKREHDPYRDRLVRLAATNTLPERPAYWLDELFGGAGVRIPGSLKQPLVWLISGPPGTGKSLLAQQIVYARARRYLSALYDHDLQAFCGKGGAKPNTPYDKIKTFDSGAISILQDNSKPTDERSICSHRSMYICTETPPLAIVNNLCHLGRLNAYVPPIKTDTDNEYIVRYVYEVLNEAMSRRGVPARGLQSTPSPWHHWQLFNETWGPKSKNDATKLTPDPLAWFVNSKVPFSAMNQRNKRGLNSEAADQLVGNIDATWKALAEESSVPKEPGECPYGILAIDSLNLLADVDDQAYAVNKILDSFRAKEHQYPAVLMIILDTSEGHYDNTSAKHLEYLADIWMHFRRDYRKGYAVTTTEIVKARFQQHAAGQHIALHYPLGDKAAKKYDEAARRWGEVLSTTTPSPSNVNENAGGESLHESMKLVPLDSKNKERSSPFDRGLFRRPYLSIGGHRVIETYSNDDRAGPDPILSGGGLFIIPSIAWFMTRLRSGPVIQLSHVKADLQNWWRLRRINSPIRTFSASEHAIKLSFKPKPWGWHPPELLSRQWSLLFKALQRPTGPVVEPASTTPIIPWPVPWLGEVVGGNIRRGETIALVGQRGEGKVLFSALFLLDGIARQEDTLFLSFGEDRSTIERVFESLNGPNRFGDGRVSSVTRNALGKKDEDECDYQRLHIVHQRPGFTLPEEIFHRVLHWIAQREPWRAVISPIDHWERSFPLISEPAVLLRAILELFERNRVATMVVANTDPDRPDRDAGVSAFADYLLRFDVRELHSFTLGHNDKEDPIPTIAKQLEHVHQNTEYFKANKVIASLPLEGNANATVPRLQWPNALTKNCKIHDNMLRAIVLTVVRTTASRTTHTTGLLWRQSSESWLNYVPVSFSTRAPHDRRGMEIYSLNATDTPSSATTYTKSFLTPPTHSDASST